MLKGAGLDDKLIFAKEAELLAKINHPNIVKLIGVCEEPVIIVMEFLEFSLRPFGREDTFTDVDALLCYLSDEDIYYHFPKIGNFIARDLVQSVAYLHSQDIVHRDIKPSNILVSNLHYDENTAQEVASSCPIVCKLGDLGEARSKLVQTRKNLSVTKNHTKKLNRGSSAFQAPETLVDEMMLPSANPEDLKRADIWSMVMSIFIVLNPSLRQPFQENMKNTDATENMLKDLLRLKSAPEAPSENEMNTAVHYQTLRNLFYRSFNYNPDKRPDAKTMLETIEIEIDTKIQHLNLKNSQNTALEEADRKVSLGAEFEAPDNDGSNCCTFLSLAVIDKLHGREKIDDNAICSEIEDIITSFPKLVNPHRSTEKFYDAYEAHDIMKKAGLLRTNITFEEGIARYPICTEKTFVALKSDLENLREESFTSNHAEFLMFQAKCYVFSVAALPDGKFYVFETHPITEEAYGDKNGMVVITSSSSRLIEWFVLRLKTSGVDSSAMPYFIKVKVMSDIPEIVDTACSSKEDSPIFDDMINETISISDDDESDTNIIESEDSECDEYFQTDLSFRRPNASSQRKFARSEWFGVEKEIITTQIPFNINGLKIYNIKADDHETLLRMCKDGRNWATESRTEWKSYSSVRYRDCGGMKICTNANCKYLKQHNEPNRVKFKPNGECKDCSNQPLVVKCDDVRKYVAFISDIEADVYHIGEHRCKPKGVRLRPTKYVKAALENDIHVKPSQIQSNSIISKIRGRASWDEIEQVVRDTASIRQISNEKVKLKKEIEPSETIVDVKELKTYCDSRDKALIYEIDENRQLVFKSSRNQMQRAMEMNHTGDHFLGEEYCCFDGNFKRCRDYVTLTASVYHPMLKKQKVLATMQCKHENEV